MDDSWVVSSLNTAKNGAPAGRFLQWARAPDTSQISPGTSGAL